jgi:hypothetical protein
MTRPGDRVRRLASLICSEPTVRGIVDPAVSDLQFEYARAVRTGRVRAWFIYTRGVLACVEAVAGAWCASGSRTLPRLLAWTAGVATILTALLIWIPYRDLHAQARVIVGEPWRVLMSLVPQAVVAVLPVAMPCAAAIVLRSAPASAQLRRSIFMITIACASTTLLIFAAILPSANQTFRELVVGHPIWRGTNELTLGELWIQHAWFDLSVRGAFVCAPFALTAFVWRVLEWQRNAVGSALAIAAMVAYVAAFVAMPQLWRSFVPRVPIGWSPWVPNALYLAAAFMPRRARIVEH